jgi:hypothetical protein
MLARIVGQGRQFTFECVGADQSQTAAGVRSIYVDEGVQIHLIDTITNDWPGNRAKAFEPDLVAAGIGGGLQQR